MDEYTPTEEEISRGFAVVPKGSFILMSSASGKTAEVHRPLPKGWWKRKKPEGVE